MKQFVYFFIFLISPLFSFAQEAYIVDYDFLSNEVNTIKYVNSKQDTVLSSNSYIKISESTPLKINIKNFNTEVLEARLSIKESNVAIPQSSSAIASFTKLFSSLLGPALGINLDHFLPGTRGSAIEEDKELGNLYPDFSELKPRSEENRILLYDNLIKTKLSQINEWSKSSDHLNQLRFSILLPKKEILTKAEAIVKSISKDAPIVFSDEIKTKILLDDVAQENYNFLFLAIKAYQKELEKVDFDKLTEGSSTFMEMAKANAQRYDGIINDSLNLKINQLLGEIANGYLAIQNNPFESSINLSLKENADLLMIDIFTDSPEANQYPLKSQSVKIKVTRNVAFFNTLGVSFVGYSIPLRQYSLDQNSRIVGDRGDAVLPTPSLFMNFTKPSEKAVKFGGNFGIGVPLTDGKAIHFQLGPSIFLGKENPISINLGLATGRVDRLGGGLKIGDTFTRNALIPMIKRYELGYFFGLSFNMTGGFKRTNLTN